VLVAVVLALIAAGCGNSGSDDSATETTKKPSSSGAGGATDVGVTDKDITVSLMMTKTGPNAIGEAGFDKGFEAYVESVNAAGGVNGRKIKIASTRDDASQPARQVSEYGQIMSQDKPFILVQASGNMADADKAIEDEIPVVAMYTDSGIMKSDNFFAVNGSWKAPDPTNLPAAPLGLNFGIYDAYILKKKGESTMASFGYNISASAKSAKDTCKEANEFGVKCAFEDTSLAFGFTDIGASIAKLKSAGVTHVWAAMDVGGCVTMLRSLKRAGMNDATLRCAVLPADADAPKYADVSGNLFAVSNYAPFDSDVPEMKKLVKEMGARKPGEQLNTVVTQGWAAGILLVDGLKAAGDDLTRANFVKTIRTDPAFSTWDAHGLISQVDWTKNRWSLWADPSYKVPKSCTGYLMRGGAKKFAQVGPTPKLCVVGLDAKGLADYVKSDKSSLEP
jgi:branched-chain amino acid transport system substrate-binding protein